MTDLQFLELLRREFADYFFEDHTGKCKSTLGVLELIDLYKKTIQDETIENFINENKVFISKNLRYKYSKRAKNIKKTLVICK